MKNGSEMETAPGPVQIFTRLGFFLDESAPEPFRLSTARSSAAPHIAASHMLSSAPFFFSELPPNDCATGRDSASSLRVGDDGKSFLGTPCSELEGIWGLVWSPDCSDAGAATGFQHKNTRSRWVGEGSRVWLLGVVGAQGGGSRKLMGFM